jgi:hypothetical protein
MLRFGHAWNDTARAAFFRIPTVEQPFWEILSDRPAIEAALADPKRLRPLQHHYRGTVTA